MLRRGEPRKDQSPRTSVVDKTLWAKENLALPEARGTLVYLKEWTDHETKAKGWLTRWGDPDVNVSGGGVRMRVGGKPEEAIFLASTMFEKFGIAGPGINGSKFVIDFDPFSPQKSEVLERFLQSFLPDLENIGTAGDLGVSEQEVSRVLTKYGIQNPQKGILKALNIESNLDHLTGCMNIPLKEPMSAKHEQVVDVTAGWSTYVAIRTFFEARGEGLEGKTVAIQGVGAVGGSAGYYLEKLSGARIVAVADKNGTMLLNGASFSSILKEIDVKTGCLTRDRVLALGDSNEILCHSADILILAAASEVVTTENVSLIVAPVIFEGANHPITQEAEKDLEARGIQIVPDFVVNAGTAELFTVGMLLDCPLEEEIVLANIEAITQNATKATIDLSQKSGQSLRQSARVVSTQNLWKSVVY